MWTRLVSGRSLQALVLTFSAWFESSGHAQVPQPQSTSLESEVLQIKAENSVIREQLRKLEEEQNTVLQMMEELQRRLDGRPAAIAKPIASCTAAPR